MTINDESKFTKLLKAGWKKFPFFLEILPSFLFDRSSDVGSSSAYSDYDQSDDDMNALIMQHDFNQVYILHDDIAVMIMLMILGF